MSVQTDFLLNEIKNYSDTHKWMWTVLLGFAFIGATRGLIDALWDPETNIYAYNWPSVACYTVFVTFIYRFYVGDRRIVDYLYSSVATASAARGDATLKTFLSFIGRGTLLWESSSRVFQMIFFIAAALLIDRPVQFAHAITALLLANSLICLCWILFTLGRRAEFHKLTDQVVGSEFKYKRYRLIWLGNNLAFGLLGIAVISLLRDLPTGNPRAECLAGLFAVLLLLNSVIDLYFCRAVYLPKFEQLLGKQINGQTPEDARSETGIHKALIDETTEAISKAISKAVSSNDFATLADQVRATVTRALREERQRQEPTDQVGEMQDSGQENENGKDTEGTTDTSKKS